MCRFESCDMSVIHSYGHREATINRMIYKVICLSLEREKANTSKTLSAKANLLDKATP